MTSTPYILISVVAFLLVALFLIALFLRTKKQNKPLSKLGALSLVLVIGGIAFGENRAVGYSLIGIGLLLAVLDIIKKSRSKNENTIQKQ